MKARESTDNTLNVLLLFVAGVILASWFVQAAGLVTWRSWEDSIDLLGMQPLNYQALKAVLFCTIMLVFLFKSIRKRKTKKYQLPKL